MFLKTEVLRFLIPLAEGQAGLIVLIVLLQGGVVPVREWLWN